MNNSPIGVFDSGMGGLSVWRELKAALPGESMIYYGDGLHCPYGDKSAEDVLGYIEEAIQILIDHHAKLVVLACNTATMTAIRYLRNKYPIPFIGMEPALKPAAATTRSGVVGVLATKGAICSEWFDRLKEKYSEGVRIIPAVGHGFVEAVEAGEENSPRTRRLVEEAIRPLLEAGADRIVLGCTHYPFLAAVIRDVASNPGITIIDPAPAVARRTEYILRKYSLSASGENVPHYEFLSAAGPAYEEKLARKAVLL